MIENICIYHFNICIFDPPNNTNNFKIKKMKTQAQNKNEKRNGYIFLTVIIILVAIVRVLTPANFL